MKPQGGSKKRKSNLPFLWAALLLGIISPIALYFSLRGEFYGLSIVFFLLISAGMALTALKG